jgi:hypothetical protein
MTGQDEGVAFKFGDEPVTFDICEEIRQWNAEDKQNHGTNGNQ